MNDYNVVVLGAGAAGLVAATEAATRGKRVLLLEKNARPGVKILMSGGTRCNITQRTDKRGIIKAFGAQGSFLHSALAALSPDDVVRMIEAEGCPTKVEDTGKIFPVSDRATDVLDALLARFHRSGAELATEEPVREVRRGYTGLIVVTEKRTLNPPQVIVTVGGQSYPGCGTRGEGYGWAAALGHTIVPLRPALTPLSTAEAWVKELQGLTIPDVFVRVVLSQRSAEFVAGAKPLSERRGSFLFTHWGLSGPSVLDVSRAVTGHPRPTDLDLTCDFLPDMPVERLDQELQQAAAADGKKQVIGIVSRVIPRRLAEALLPQTGLSLEARGAEWPKAARRKLAERIKRTVIPLAGFRGYEKAEVTAGGVSLAEVDSHTLQSKLVPGLYFAGEVLDLDGPIGGYNFQAAFSTGMLAGRSV